MFQDLARNMDVSAVRGPRIVRMLLTLGTVRYQSVFLYRLSVFSGSISPFLGHLIKQFNHIWTGADISWQAQIGNSFVLFHPTGVVIGSAVVIGANCEVQQGVTFGGSRREVVSYHDSPRIGDNVYVGAGARIIGAVRVGNNVAIGANAVVINDVAAGSVAVGVPASTRRRSV